MATNSSDIFRILTVSPNLIQVEVLDAEKFKQDTSDFTIGSYLKISDDSNTAIIALVQSFKIKETNLIGETSNVTTPTFILDSQPIGFLDDQGKFRRGGQQIAIPPNNVEIADEELLKSIYSSIEKDKQFCFPLLQRLTFEKRKSKQNALAPPLGTSPRLGVPVIRHGFGGPPPRAIHGAGRLNRHPCRFTPQIPVEFRPAWFDGAPYPGGRGRQTA